MPKGIKKWIDIKLPYVEYESGTSRMSPAVFLNAFPALAKTAKIFTQVQGNEIHVAVYTNLALEEIQLSVEALKKQSQDEDAVKLIVDHPEDHCA